MHRRTQSSPWKPGWPWELEIITLIFLIFGAVFPVYMSVSDSLLGGQNHHGPVIGAALAANPHFDARQFITSIYWALGLLALYAVHIFAGSVTLAWHSAPIWHTLSPLVFSALAYCRLSSYAGLRPEHILISTGPIGILLWVSGTLALVIVAGSLTRRRVMRRMRPRKWIVDTPTILDRTWFKLFVFLRPLLYPPRRVKLDEEGICIEGLNYAITMPFDIIQAVEYISLPSIFSHGLYFATSARHLVSIRLKDWSEPIIISPRDRDRFVTEAQKIIEARRPPTKCGTRPGTKTKTASRTQRGKISDIRSSQDLSSCACLGYLIRARLQCSR